MKKLVFYFALLLVSVWLGVKIHSTTGYVLIAYQHWSVETTLWFALFIVMVVFIVLYLFLRLIGGTARLSGRWQFWLRQRHVRKSRKWTSRGLCELAEANWTMAEKYLVRGAKANEVPLINYLAAARAAQGQALFERRDDYLKQAYDCTGGAEEVAVGLTQAQLQLASKQFERALATLRQLHQLVPRHAYVLKLLQAVYAELRDWEGIKALLPALRKYSTLDSAQLHGLEQTVYLALLEEAAHSGELAKITATWQVIPQHLQKDRLLLFNYTGYLIKFKRDTEAEELLREALKKSWSTLLVSQYGFAQALDPAKQLSAAENWLKNHEHDAALLLSLGQICARNRLWGKARGYLETSLKLEAKAQTYRELGNVLEQLGDNQAAFNCYRTGLQTV